MEIPKLWTCVLLAACSPTPDAGEPPDAARWRDLKQRIRAEFDDVEQVTIAAFVAGRGDATVLVDVRAPEEFRVSRIAGARNAPLDAGVVAALADVPRDRPIVVYCSVGWRSSLAARELTAAGYTSVQNLEGSLFEWANDGRPLVDDGGTAGSVHGFDAEWETLLRPELRAPIR